ncbi:Insect cuticle protein [Popillia japonica]|uniref:Insect cuticle protein n=1 Tax=Popillia japonica TaxID=7064 RepID=A0AAW1IXH5_POPJA
MSINKSRTIFLLLWVCYAYSFPVGEEDVISDSAVGYDQDNLDVYQNAHVELLRRPTTYYRHQYLVPVAAKVAPVSVASGHDVNQEHAPAKYQFQYKVEDDQHGDYKYHTEERDGDVVKGEYSFKEADGTVRIVKYTVESKSGFNAVIIKRGQPTHPQVQVNKAVRHQAAREPNYYDHYK